MKKILVFCLFIACFCAQGQVAEIELRDSTFTRAMNIFLDSVARLDIEEKVVVLVSIKKLDRKPVNTPIDHPVHGRMYEERNVLSYEMILTLESSQGIFKYYVPSFAFLLKKMKCFVVFNVEDLFELSESNRKAVLKQTGKSFSDNKGSSMLARMEISVQDRNITVGVFGH